jgi:hypothetical protein
MSHLLGAKQLPILDIYGIHATNYNIKRHENPGTSHRPVCPFVIRLPEGVYMLAYVGRGKVMRELLVIQE